MGIKTQFWAGCLLSRLVLLGFLLTAGVGLMPDEAQYWTWSLFPDWGYYSKPPGIAWQIFLGTHLFGSNELGVRILSLLLPIPMALLIKKIVCSLTSDTRTGYLTGLAFLLSPLGMSASILATTDGGLLLFGLAAVYFALQENSPIRTGISLALGALWKWMAFSLLIPITLYKCIRREWSVSAFLITCLAALLGLLPSLLWNIHHGFATFRHVGGTLFNIHSSHPAPNPLFFFLAGVLLISPGFFLLSLPPFFSWKKDKALLVKISVITIFGSLFIASFFRKMQGNWAVLGQIFLFPLMGCYLAAAKRKWPFYASVLVSLALQTLFLAGPYVKGPLFEKNPLRQGIGIEKLTDALAVSGYRPGHFLFSDRYQTVSQAWFYTKEKIYFLNLSHLRYNQYSFWPGMEKECLGQDGFYISLAPPSEKKSLSLRVRQMKKKLRDYFEHVEKPKIHALRSHGRIGNYLIIIPVKNYSGKTPEEKGFF